MVRAALCVDLECYFTLIVAILTENCPLIIRTTTRMVIRESENRVFIGFLFRPIIGAFQNTSRGLENGLGN